jgi:putative Mg2+ transporter-C (MgtC) family protein
MSWRDEVLDTIASEFSDVTDVAQLTRIVLRLTLAGVLGFLLGFEREQAGKAAGVRTHMLVAIGSAMFVLIPQQTGIRHRRHEPRDSRAGSGRGLFVRRAPS